MTITARKPRVVSNILGQTIRFPSGNVAGTGTAVQSRERAGLNGILTCASGAAGWAWNTTSFYMLPGQWYCLSLEITAFSGLVGGDDPVLNLGFGTAPNNGDTTLMAAEVIAGGTGRYALVFMSTTGGTLTWRAGVGTNGGNVANKSVTFKNLMMETLNSTDGGFPSEYVYPQFKAAYNYFNASTISGNKVTFVKGQSFTVEPGNVILALGDSKSDELTDAPNQLNMTLGTEGVVYYHAKGGWKTSDIINGNTETLNSVPYTYSLSTVLAGTLLRQTFSTAGQEQMFDYYDENALRPDTLLLNNFGVNNLVAGSAAGITVGSTVADIAIIISSALAAGIKYVIISEINPWNAHAAFVITNGAGPATFALNRQYQELAKANGYIFVPIYAELGDSTDPNKLSDGGGSTPNYSADALHLNINGQRFVGSLIKSARDEYFGICD